MTRAAWCVRRDELGQPGFGAVTEGRETYPAR